MTRVVIDPNVLIAALISPRGAPADIYRTLSRGGFELVASSQLLAELERVLQRPKFRRYGSIEEAHQYVAAIGRLSTVVEDPPPSRHVPADVGDDYLVTLARAVDADAIVSGDHHLLDLRDPWPPVLTPRAFIELVGDPPVGG